MSTVMFLLVVLVAVDPPRSGLSARASLLSFRAWAGAGVLTLVVVAVLAVAGGSIIDGLEVRPESWRIAAGIVAGFTAVRRLLTGMPVQEPTLARITAAAVPGTFPILLRPVVVMLAVAGGVDHGAGATIGGFVVALGLAMAAGAVTGRGASSRLWLAGSKLLTTLLVVGSVAMIISGIADI